MLDTDFTALKDFILEHNNYFSTGYANAYKDENTHAVWVKSDGRATVEFIRADWYVVDNATDDESDCDVEELDREAAKQKG